ncbi:MAG: hypothetical protein R2941_07395 [Desulfobacterales bacterium]
MKNRKFSCFVCKMMLLYILLFLMQCLHSVKQFCLRTSAPPGILRSIRPPDFGQTFFFDPRENSVVRYPYPAEQFLYEDFSSGSLADIGSPNALHWSKMMPGSAHTGFTNYLKPPWARQSI